MRPGWLPLNAVTVLDGDPGLGKSTITLDWAAEATGAGSDVLLLSAEDNLDSTLRPRIEAAGADMDRVHSLEAVETDNGEEPPVLPYDIPLLEELIVAHKVKLVIIDPLMAYLDGKIHSHHDQDMRRVLHRLKMLAQKHHVAIVLMRHLNKDDSTRNPLYRGGGSIGISAAVRSRPARRGPRTIPSSSSWPSARTTGPRSPSPIATSSRRFAFPANATSKPAGSSGSARRISRRRT